MGFLDNIKKKFRPELPINEEEYKRLRSYENSPESIQLVLGSVYLSEEGLDKLRENIAIDMKKNLESIVQKKFF